MWWRSGIFALVLLFLPATGLAQPCGAGDFGCRSHRLALAAARADWVLVTTRLAPDFWRNWLATDRAVERLFERQPGFRERVHFEDPAPLLHALPWVLEELARNVRVLEDLGRPDVAASLAASGERLAAATGSPRDLLLLNTLCRFLLAGWRDEPDPPAALRTQVEQLLQNLEALRHSLSSAARIPAAAGRGPYWFPWLLDPARQGQTLLYGPVRLLLPAPALARRLHPVLPGWPGSPRASENRHAAAADDLAFAFGLPFGLVPPGRLLLDFLAALPANQATGPALLLGAGDGAEARATAMTGRFKPVLAVEHSGLAIVRMRALNARLADRLLTHIVPVHADVRAIGVPEGTALVVAIHLLEYLDETARHRLYGDIASSLAPGGTVLLAVHLAMGPRFEETRAYANVTATELPRGTRLVIADLVPDRPEAHQVQFFFSRQGIADELEEHFPATDGFQATVQTVRTGNGLEEARITIRRIR